METSVKYHTRVLKPVIQHKPHPKFRCGSRHKDVSTPSGLGCCLFRGGASVVDDSLFDVAPIVLGLCFKVYFLLSFIVCCHLAEA